MNKDEALKLAKELDGVIADVEEGNGFDDVCLDTVKYVRDALAEQPTCKQPLQVELPAQQPAAWRSWSDKDGYGFWDTRQEAEVWCAEDFDPEPLYTSPPASKPWVGLTDKEIRAAYRAVSEIEWAFGGMDDATPFARDIEKKLREKNTGEQP